MSSTVCSALETTPPWDRTPSQHAEVANWFRIHASKFFYNISSDPNDRNKALESLAREARLHDCVRGGVVCAQNESCDNVFVVYSGCIDIYYLGNSNHRKKGTMFGR